MVATRLAAALDSSTTPISTLWVRSHWDIFEHPLVLLALAERDINMIFEHQGA